MAWNMQVMLRHFAGDRLCSTKLGPQSEGLRRSTRSQALLEKKKTRMPRSFLNPFAARLV